MQSSLHYDSQGEKKEEDIPAVVMPDLCNSSTLTPPQHHNANKAMTVGPDRSLTLCTPTATSTPALTLQLGLEDLLSVDRSDPVRTPQREPVRATSERDVRPDKGSGLRVHLS